MQVGIGDPVTALNEGDGPFLLTVTKHNGALVGRDNDHGKIDYAVAYCDTRWGWRFYLYAADEGVTWVRGHYLKGSEVVNALLAANALRRRPAA